ncbi:MAG: RNA polymerase sigma factor FliA [Campylobacterales bacterium]|nr:RNA polymerase sigma factor FliA [Campylobacterales bacterium]
MIKDNINKDVAGLYGKNLKFEQDSLAIQFLPAVKAMAYRLKERLPSSVDTVDLISIGAEELVKLARKYDKNLNDSFWGYAKTRVYGSMLDYLRTLDIVSRGNRKLIKKIDEESLKFLNEHGKEPTDNELAEILHESVEKINEAKVASDIYTLMPLNEQMSLFDKNETLEIIEKDELIEIIKKILSTLTQREQLIVQLYYFEELSLKEMCEILDITESRISQIHKCVIKKIREALK